MGAACGLAAAALAPLPAGASSISPVASIGTTGPLPPTWYIPDNQRARDYRQKYNLTCEVSCFKMVLFHYQMDAPEELLQDLLGRNENPNKGFRGDYWALSTNGLQNYGAHAPALKTLIDRFPKPGIFNAVLLSNLGQAKVALTRNWLVIAWTPVALERSYTQRVTLSTGEQVNLVPGEHTIVLHGYDGSGFYPYDSRPSPRVPGFVRTEALARAMSLFDHPALAVQPLF